MKSLSQRVQPTDIAKMRNRYIQCELIVSFLFLTLLSLNAFTQNNESFNCPILEVLGPGGITMPGELAKFRAVVKPESSSYNLAYEWSVSAGDIDSGQGTAEIAIRQPDRLITATVKVFGFPEGCTNTASESQSFTIDPGPIKIGQFEGGLSPAAKSMLDEAVAAAANNPDAQIYFLTGHIDGVLTAAVRRRESELFEYLISKGLDDQRITKVVVDGKRELIQLWLVPPGANEPGFGDFEEPDKKGQGNSCGSIELRGPEGITRSGEEFSVRSVVKIPDDVLFRVEWTVKPGMIKLGQGTSEIVIEADNDPDLHKIIVNARVVGDQIPSGCALTANDSFVISSKTYDVFPVDKYRHLTVKDENARLDNVAIMSQRSADDLLFFIFASPKTESRAEIERHMAFIIKRLVGRYKIERGRIIFAFKEAAEASTTIYFFPKSVSMPWTNIERDLDKFRPRTRQ